MLAELSRAHASCNMSKSRMGLRVWGVGLDPPYLALEGQLPGASYGERTLLIYTTHKKERKLSKVKALYK